MANGNNDKLPFNVGGSGGTKSGNGIFEPAPAQKTGGDGTINPASIPSGGIMPKVDPGPANNGDIGVGAPGGRKPFKVTKSGG